ncbi:MAG: hypothetical protein KC535_01255 [Nanoarchaeota archaeon]|nr:hypothetical protein [Nanoarchaeota archaeon]
MHNKPLDPKVHFIVGILISAFSAYTLLFTEVPNKSVMQLFLYIGLGFIALAFLKKGIRYIREGGLKKDERELAAKISGVPQAAKEEEYQDQLKRQAQLQERNRPSIVACQLCGTRNYSTSNYCHMCGYKLR